jgi:branched-chain amino acid transport system substrate-binding protein
VSLKNLLKTFLISLLIPLTCSTSYGEEKDTVKIGVLLCQTGNCADWGLSALKGAQLATEQINAAGGVLSKKVELIVEDSADSISGAKSVSAFQSLLAKNLNYYIGPSWSPAALAIAPIAAKRNDVILITPSASAREFSRSATHMFNLRPPEELATRSLARYAYNQGKRRAAIFSSQQPAESTQGRIFEDEFKKLGGEVAIRIEAIPTQTELKTEALKITSSLPDVIFLMNYNQIETGIKDLNNLGYRGMRMAISLDDARIAGAHGLFEGLIVGRAAEPTEEFRNAFKRRFGEASGLSAEGGYDAVMSLAQAINDTGNAETISKVRDNLHHGKYSGAIGSFTFDDSREVVQAPVLFVVKSGKLVLISLTREYRIWPLPLFL